MTAPHERGAPPANRSWSPGRLLRVVVATGVAASMTEAVCVLSIQAVLGVSPLVVFQSIASGALGRSAFADGFAIGLLGLAIHVLISIVAAAMFLAIAYRRESVLRHTVASGLAYGLLTYVVMTFVVVPLSAIGFRPPRSLVLAALSVAVHVFAFGLPIALLERALLARDVD